MEEAVTPINQLKIMQSEMISFKVSAPGKVILFGEHSVVYGKTAVAASLGLRSNLRLTVLTSEERVIRLEMPKIQISRSFSLDQVEKNLLEPSFPKLSVVGHDEFHQRIKNFVETLDIDDLYQRNSIECVFYALIQIIQAETLRLDSFSLELDSELSIGAGAGSSASFAVCLVAGFLRWSQLQKNPDAKDKFDSSSLKKISDYAFNCEKIMHGKPSGIDNSICTFGSVIEFRKSEALKFIALGSRSLNVLLVDTKVARSTKKLVDKFATFSVIFPTIFNDVLQVFDGVSKQAIDIIKQISATSKDEYDQLLKLYKDLSLLVDMNQGLLATCQVSHESLNTICNTAKKYNFSAKLTGAGGGGFAYVLIPPNADTVKVKDLISELRIHGFLVTETRLGGSGVEIHDTFC